MHGGAVDRRKSASVQHPDTAIFTARQLVGTVLPMYLDLLSINDVHQEAGPTAGPQAAMRVGAHDPGTAHQTRRKRNQRRLAKALQLALTTNPETAVHIFHHGVRITIS